MIKKSSIKGLGGRIRLARKNLELSGVKLAKKINVEQPHISDWDLDKRPPSLKNMVLLSNALGVSVDWLLGKYE